MRQRTINWLVFIIILAAVLAWVNLPNNPGLHIHTDMFGVRIDYDQDFPIRQGLDLQGGLQVLLQADLAEAPSSEAMEQARIIVENRVNALGVTEAIVQTQGDRRIIVELPGIDDPDVAVSTIRATALLEFVDAGFTYIEPGTRILTTIAADESQPSPPVPTPAVPVSPTLQAGQVPVTASTAITDRVFTTIIQGSDLVLDQVRPALDDVGTPQVVFALKTDGARTFAQFTAQNNEQTLRRPYYLCIVLDKIVVSCPSIQEPIPSGQGSIRVGDVEYAQNLSIQLRYGALPVPLRVETSRVIGPTLGQISIEKSTRAGVVGVLAVLLFMLIYYRVPGLLADLALIVYMLLNFTVYRVGIPSSIAIFPLAPVTLTLPGITGFLLSTGMAVDANILIFERMKEELRAGRSLRAAVEAGFDRAWAAIRDSNLSTIITCVILYLFGTNFGASVVKGFAITLGLGVLISMFTAVVVTRTFLRTAVELAEDKLRDKHWLLGV